AGLGFCVSLRKGPFLGRDALLAGRQAGLRRRLRTLLVGGPEYLTLYGGEAVSLDGRVVSRIRSCAYGHTVGRNVAFAYLPPDLDDTAAPLEVEVFGRQVAAQLAPDVLYDPDGRRVKG
ncbi:MAG TPA: glycine cleavage T C-terminal barrel domain-containing protein, partial [Candidatus Limnocylindrales bacterium]|nr:glycine cleavage T C-terminal barrel domain-containing protein [Candidatus Limnocylindrales bacterium]